MSKILFIIDLDNTLSNGLRREQLAGPEPDRLREKQKYEEWLNVVMQGFEADAPVIPTALILRRLYLDSYTPTFIVTARNEEHRAETEKWLKKHFYPMPRLIMRPRFNTAPSALWKQDVIRELVGKTEASDVCVVDDDELGGLQKVCKDNGWNFMKMFIAKETK